MAGQFLDPIENCPAVSLLHKDFSMRSKSISIPLRPNMTSPQYVKLAKALKPIFLRLLNDKSIIFLRPNVTR